MGCKHSKAAVAVLNPSDQKELERSNRKLESEASFDKNGKPRSRESALDQQTAETLETVSEPVLSFKDHDQLYKLLVDVSTLSTIDDNYHENITAALSPSAAAYRSSSNATPLHVAVRLCDSDGSTLVQSNRYVNIIDELIRAHPESVCIEDDAGNLPLHYVIAPTIFPHNLSAASWSIRTAALRLLLAADRSNKSLEYLSRNDIIFVPGRQSNVNESNDALKTIATCDVDFDCENGGCSPLYRALQTLPDDFSQNSATLEFVHRVLGSLGTKQQSNFYSSIYRGNASDGDKPLSLLYRRFTRQFDLAEKFFSGDNSRDEVVEHRRNYKQAAGNTWKIIELLLQYRDFQLQRQDPLRQHPPTSQDDGYTTVVHRAVQGETPPDLLRYIVETNPEALSISDQFGCLPLHYAAKAKQVSGEDLKATFPTFYWKYVIDELLYKYPEAASVKDMNGHFPLTLAVNSGKMWIGGGIKSLFDAYPDALQQVDLVNQPALRRALSIDIRTLGVDADDSPETAKNDEDETENDLVQDDLNDAIMLVQHDNVDVAEVVASMWAHEEDAGLQMLGCVSVSRLINTATQKALEESKISNTTTNMDEVMRIALLSIPAVVNAMKAHPNEVIVQEKACQALKGMAWSDGRREISFVASGAVAAIIGAMQAHVSDPGVQLEACGAVGRIIHYGGPDRATVVASVSGLTAILNAIAAHPTVLGIQKDGCRALCELTEYPNANLPVLPRSQIEPLLYAAKHNFPTECEKIVEILSSRLS